MTTDPPTLERYQEIIQGAIDLLSDKERWTHGVEARDVDGESISPRDPNAICWCATGAIAHKCTEEERYFVLTLIETTSSHDFEGRGLVLVNDTLGWKEALHYLFLGKGRIPSMSLIERECAEIWVKRFL